MKDSSEISRTLNNAFRAALFLTGSRLTAETAVREGIARFEEGGPAELLAETIKAAIQRNGSLAGKLESLVTLPPELQPLFHLTPIHRNCFLLRVIFGLCPAECADLLDLSDRDFEDSLYAAFQQLSRMSFISVGPESITPEVAGHVLARD